MFLHYAMPTTTILHFFVEGLIMFYFTQFDPDLQLM